MILPFVQKYKLNAFDKEAVVLEKDDMVDLWRILNKDRHVCSQEYKK